MNNFFMWITNTNFVTQSINKIIINNYDYLSSLNKSIYGPVNDVVCD